MISSRSYHLEELSGDSFSSLDGAQQAASSPFVEALTDTIRQMLLDGRLTIQNERIVPVRHRR